jgi:hypothetical protein
METPGEGAPQRIFIILTSLPRIEPQCAHVPQCRSPAQADRGVDYLQINSTTAGCFTFRIERTTNGQ